MRARDMESNMDMSDPPTLALHALAWMLSDARRAERLLAITGLDADTLRAGIGDPAVLGAVLEHLANYEPDLIACAEALEISPAALVAAHRSLAA
jgi:adenine/guanine phosphoribosyltransferase-like PRPP-binding protein